ncbi:phosphatase PAP2 family protein [Sphingomonas sp.]|uniref:phosphatase PAP2 family protein n=1 Tax=Sphingomonas sp. TaxID=28214 RepID=UPI00338FCF76
MSSYPSGHTTNAYAMAGVLARLVPGKAPALLTRAATYAETRITCEQHWRSDVTAGEALGLVIAERLMSKPAFRAQFDAARAEMEAAGIS